MHNEASRPDAATGSNPRLPGASRVLVVALAAAALLAGHPAGPDPVRAGEPPGILPSSTDGSQAASADLAFVNANVVDAVGDEPIWNATVVVRDGTVSSIETGEVELPEGIGVVDLGGRFLLPGLIDAHVHIGDLAGARRALRSGVTTARSMGVGHFVDVGLRELSSQGRVEAPEILAAGYHVRPRPSRSLFLDEPSLGDLIHEPVKGAEAIRRVVRANLERGVDFIKTTATERAGLPETDPRQQLYRLEELQALVDEAESEGVPVAAHAHGNGGGMAAVRAGVRSIEHGTYLERETLELMAERGTYLVPTIAVVADLTRPGGDYDDPVLQIRGRHMLPQVRRTARAAWEIGVPIVAATDTGYGPESVLRLPHELLELAGLGLTPLEAIRSATTVAAELLGVDDHTGRIAPDYDADLIVVDGNPLDDVATLQDVLLVVNDGRIVLDRLQF